MLALNCGKNFQGGSADFQRDGRHRHLAAGFLGFGRETSTQLLEFGDVGFVLLGDMGNRGPGFPKMLGRLAPHPAHGDALDFAQLGEIGKRRLHESDRLRGLRRRS